MSRRLEDEEVLKKLDEDFRALEEELDRIATLPDVDTQEALEKILELRTQWEQNDAVQHRPEWRDRVDRAFREVLEKLVGRAMQNETQSGQTAFSLDKSTLEQYGLDRNFFQRHGPPILTAFAETMSKMLVPGQPEELPTPPPPKVVIEKPMTPSRRKALRKKRRQGKKRSGKPHKPEQRKPDQHTTGRNKTPPGAQTNNQPPVGSNPKTPAKPENDINFDLAGLLKGLFKKATTKTDPE